MVRDREKRRLDRNLNALPRNDFCAIRRSLARIAFCLALLVSTKAGATSFSDCLAGVRGAALAAGVDAATFDKVTRGLTPNPDVLAMAEVQPEFKTPIWDYLAGLVDEERVNDGRAMMARYARRRARAKPFRGGPGNYHGGLGRRIRFWPQLWHPPRWCNRSPP